MRGPGGGTRASSGSPGSCSSPGQPIQTPPRADRTGSRAATRPPEDRVKRISSRLRSAVNGRRLDTTTSERAAARGSSSNVTGDGLEAVVCIYVILVGGFPEGRVPYYHAGEKAVPPCCP